MRLVLRTEDGDEGFIDIEMSGTNGSVALRGFSRFEDHFFEQDPRQIYDWPDAIWHGIEQGKAIVGMTREQARLAWGSPRETTTTLGAAGEAEAWIYGKGDKVLTFSNGRLTSIRK